MKIGFVAGTFVAFGLLACSGGGGTADVGGKDNGPAADVTDPGTSIPDIPQGKDITRPDYGEVFISPDDQAFVQSYLKVLGDSKDMTTDQLFAAHYPERPYVKTLSVDPLKADYLDLIDEAYKLDPAEKDKLAANGFFVTDRVKFDSHPLAYLDIFQKDVPVLITTDSILFAIHKSYDLMLKKIEEEALIPTLDTMLAQMHPFFQPPPSPIDPVTEAGLMDGDLYLVIARSLLKGSPVEPWFGANVEKRDALLKLVDGLQPQQIELFGRAYPCGGPGCAYDFSQFKPRGHYVDSEALKQYFKAMIWLGRTELALTRHHRDFVASFLLFQALKNAGQFASWQAFDQAIRVFVGKSDNLTVEGLDAFVAAEKADQAAVIDPAKAAMLMKALEEGGYADQKIASQIVATDPFSSTPTPLPPIFLLFGQRFVIDSYVFSNVVYDRIVFQGAKVERFMPNPLDAMFVLGYPEALPILKPELDQFHYARNLHVLRYLVDSYDKTFWTESMYNVWLGAIRELAADTTGAGYPDSVRTLAYAKKSMNTGLASWAELRHDTILYAKQSYTGVACDYPDGYVEPFPGFFNRIKDFGTVSSALVKGLALNVSPWYKDSVSKYFDNLAHVGTVLGGIAGKEIANEPRTPEQTAFIKSLVQADSMCGAPPFSGWYKELFFDATDTTFEFKPTIADVHTDPNSTNVLHVGTGRASLMVLVANTSCGSKAYAGPASSYYEDLEAGFARLTDQEWMTKLDTANPSRPAWTADFMAGK